MLKDSKVKQRHGEMITGVKIRGGILTPPGGTIPALFLDPNVIQNIKKDCRIGGLKLVVAYQ